VPTPLYDDPSATGHSAALLEGGSGTTVAKWLVNAAPQADAGASPFSAPRSLEVLVASADLAGVTRASFPAPPSLAARTGNTSSIDAEYTGSGALFRWVETSVAQDPAGAVHDTLTLRTVFVSASGASTEPRTLATCADCSIAVSSGASPAFAYVLFRGGNGVSGVLRVSSDGSAFEILPLPSWLASGASLPSLALSNAQLVARIASSFTPVDDDLERVAGPFVAGAGNAAFDWSPSAPLVLSLGPAGAGEGGAVVDLFGFSAGQDVPDLLLTTFGPSLRTTRISTANAIAGVARDDRELGVTFTADGRDYFALVDTNGEKRGGDLDLAATSPGVGATQRLVRTAPAHYAELQFRDGALTKREVTCEE
jgi:hypothetical protein